MTDSKFDAEDPWQEMLNGNWDDLPMQSPPLTPPLQQQPSGSTNHSQNQNYQQFSIGQMQHDSNGVFSPRQLPANAMTTSSQTGSICNEELQLRLDRESEGRCADCGAQTHEVQFDPSGSGRMIKSPLTVPGEVHRGRCLFCHPLPASLSRKGVDSNSPPSQAFDALDQQPQPMPSRSSPLRRSTTSCDQPLCLKRPSMSHDQPLKRPSMSYNQPQTVPLKTPWLHTDLALPTPSLSDSQGYRSELSNSMHAYRENTSCSVSESDSHSVYSHQSAPVWSGGQQHQPPQHQAFKTEFSADFVEKYQQQQQLIEQMQKELQLQQAKNLDDGSLSQHSFHSFHSQQSTHSQAYYPHSSSQQSLSTNHIESQFPLTVSAKLPIHSLNNVNEYDYTAVAAICQQIKKEPNLDFGTYIQTMQQFPSFAPIQATALTKLLPQTENVEVSQAIGNMGGISIILDAMRNHPHHLIIQRSGCESVRALCTHPHNRQVIIQSGGIQLIVKMMSWHVNDTDLLCSGCKALASVAEGGMEYKIAVAEAGGILAVMKAVEVHSENDVLLTAAYQALRMLGYNPASK